MDKIERREKGIFFFLINNDMSNGCTRGKNKNEKDNFFGPVRDLGSIA